MPGPDVTLVMGADEKAAIRAIAKMEAKVQKLEGKLKDVNKTSKKTQASLNTAFDAKKVAKFVGGLVGAGSVLAAWNAVNQAVNRNIELTRAATGTQVTLASARKDLIRNLVGKSEDEKKRILDEAASISSETGVSERDIAQALASAVSASGGDAKVAIASVRAAAKFLPDKPEDIASYAGSLIDLSKVTGTTDAATNAAFLSMIGAQSRVVAPKQQARNIPKALIGQMPQGVSPQEAAALFATQTTSAADFEGSESKTAVIALASQIDDMRKGEGAFKGLRDRDRIQAETLTEVLRELQQSDRKQAVFLDKASFEKSAQGPIEQLITDATSTPAKLFGQYAAQYPQDLSTLGPKFQEEIRHRFVDPLETPAAAQRASTQTVERVQADMVGRSLKQQMFDSFNAFLEQHKYGDLGWMDKWTYQAFDEQGSLDYLRGRRNDKLKILRMQDRGKADAFLRETDAMFDRFDASIDRLNQTAETQKRAADASLDANRDRVRIGPMEDR